MPPPLQKNRNNIRLLLNTALYLPEHIAISLKEYSISRKKVKTTKKYTSIEFAKTDLLRILEFGNHLLSLHR